jgi:cytochrome P450
MSGAEIPDLADPKTYARHDPHEIWRRLRQSDPVHWHTGDSGRPAFWVLTRYADIVEVLRDDTRFTSERGNVLATMLAGGDTGAGRMMAVTDGSYHTELRKLLLKAFTPRALHTVVQRVRRVTRRLLTEAIERGGCIDFAQDIASAIPLETICDLLDIPPNDRQYVLDLTKSALAFDDDTPDADAERPTRGDILLYFSDLVADRRRHPGTDPVSLMAGAEVAGRTLDDEDIILNCYSLIMGGNETSRFSMIGAVQAFIDFTDQWSLLRNGDVGLDSAGEEVLRWATPTMHFGRTATENVQLAGRTIAAGDLVTLWLASANRDEDIFPDPGNFIIARSPNKHLALGHGRHFCLGAYLGRIEIQAMLDGLRTFVSDIEPAGEARHIYSNFLSGISSLPVILKGDAKGYREWDEEM